MEVTSESDWEYEYDENETEDFYFTLDVPVTVERASKRRKTNTGTSSHKQASNGVSQSPGTQPVSKGRTEDDFEDSEPQPAPITFEDLHTTTPTVTYGDQYYECGWTTDLGTQFHVSKPGLTPTPFRPGHAVDVVALSRVRLTGCRVTPPSSPKAKSAAAGDANHAIVLDDDEGDPIRETHPAGRQYQLSFLERVAEIQRGKREQTTNAASGEHLTSTSKPPSTDIPLVFAGSNSDVSTVAVAQGPPHSENEESIANGSKLNANGAELVAGGDDSSKAKADAGSLAEPSV